MQHLEQDSGATDGPCHDSTTAENIVEGLMFGNAEMVRITYHTVQVTFFILSTRRENRREGLQCPFCRI